MIIGDYYINNFLVLAIVLLLFGGLAFVVVPGGGGGGDTEPGQNQSNSYDFLVQGEGLQAGSSQTITLVNDGQPVTGVPVLLNGEEIGTTGSDGSVAVDVPDQSSVTVSASGSQVDAEKTFEVEASEGGSGEDSSEGDGSDGSDQEGSEGDEGSDSSDDDTGDGSSGGEENDTEENSTIKPAINRLTPENQQLDSPEFEASYELAASNASYRISLNGEQKASGDLDGEKTVSEQLSMSVNGTVGLEAEIFRDQNVLASEDFTVNYTADTDSDEGSDDSDSDNDSTSDPAEVTAELSAPSSVMVNDQVELDASGSSGDIINYTWELGDGTIDTTESASLTHTYSSEGNYDVLVTVNGENGTEDNASATVEVQGVQKPDYSLYSPGDGGTVEIVGSQTSVDLEYNITDRKWATSANLSLENDSSVLLDKPVSVASGSYTEEVSELSPGDYNYSLELLGDGNVDRKSLSFSIRQIEPYYEVLEWNETLLENGYEANFQISYNVSDSSLLEANIFNSSGVEVRSFSRFVDGYGDLAFNKSFMQPDTFEWYINITSGEDIVASTKSETRQFQTEESNPNDN